MGCCNPSDVEDQSKKDLDSSEKFAKGGANDLSDGPVKKRGCTDIPCCLLFIASFVFFLFCAFLGVSDGNLHKLVNPRDYAGDYCGIAEQWNNGQNLEAHKHSLYTLNVTEAFDAMAEAFVCSSPVQEKLKAGGLVTAAQFTAACSGSTSTCTSLSACTSQAQDSFAQYFDASKVTDLLTGKGTTSILTQITKYFNQVCTTSCSTASTSASRQVTYMPGPDEPWYGVWKAMVDGASSVGIDTSAFNFSALPASVCPYEAKMCVPLPGLTFTELYHGYCTIEVDTGVLTNITGELGGALGGVASSAVNQMSAGVSNAFGDITDTMDVLVLTAFVSLVIGLVFLILLRFFVKPVVWLSILLVSLLGLAGGYVLYYYSQMCADDSIVNAASQAGLVSVSNSTCGGLYHFEDETTRTVLEYSGYVTFGLAGLWLLLVLCMCSRIRLAIAVNEVAAQFVYQTPHVVLVPLVQFAAAVLWSIAWLFLVAFLVSQVPADFVPTESYATYAEAYGTDDTAGKCTGMYPSGYVYFDASASTCNSTLAEPKCWSCSPPRYVLDYRFWFSLLMFFWNNAFCVAAGQCTIAGAVGIWFFNHDKSGSRAKSFLSVFTAVKHCFVYHLGSLAFGSLILAIVQTLKWFMYYLSKQAKAQKNKVMEYIAKGLACCLWCFEKCIKFLNKNAYIQVALLGTSFCTSAKNAFFLILRNAARFGILGGLGAVIHLIGKTFIIVSTALLGFLFLEAMHPELESPYLLICVYCAIGYFSGALFMNVFGMAVDAALQCFIATEEMQLPDDIIPEKLRSFVNSNGPKGPKESE